MPVIWNQTGSQQKTDTNRQDSPSIPQTSLRTCHQSKTGKVKLQWTFLGIYPHIISTEKRSSIDLMNNKRWSQQHISLPGSQRLTWHPSGPKHTSWHSAWSSSQMTSSSSWMEQTCRWTWQQQHSAINHHTFQTRGVTEDGCTVGWTECRIDRDTNF